MTVGHELSKLTGFRLFHNHVTIELVLEFFDYGSPPFERLVAEFRRRIFEEVAGSDLPGLIFTFVWAVEHNSDRAFVERSCDIFRTKGAEVYFVELEAELPERLRRNETEFRLSRKPSKRDVAKSREHLLETDRKYKLNSDGGQFIAGKYIRIENTDLPADQAALRIAEEFGFTSQPPGADLDV